ncbi:sugar ABC transporter ATP-binding protein [Paenibacillus naphthalenovorans]|uniref:sugar ABC transporter ATP-binding protein n=1 Tax=Paenibacillus naphthalenovorans TaxID=162209 RepID=UPI0010BC2809|nr:sugar ABC transporter ATP-binding protein [Paenibacillus naphthalenovorans]GCL71537.1 sugar ABC transporter ATP-binding protein [Paenibacillus naphthalenovorans]
MLLQISNVYKSFGGKEVLKNVEFAVDYGEIHGLVGKNGAGKSTLVNIISGVLSCDSGAVELDSQPIDRLSVLERQDLGIYVVPQHATIIPEFSVAENLFLGVWLRKKAGLVDWKPMFEKAEQELREYGLPIDPRMKAKDLSLVNQRKLNIVRALFSKAKLIILDEPTTALSADERNSLFEFVLKLKKQGTGIIFISHYLEEVLKLCDRITVIRDGLSFTGYAADSVDERSLTNLIVGEDVELCTRTREPGAEKEPILECRNIKGKDLKDVSFRLHRGEILGLIGFPGSGAREICRGLFGLYPVESGEIHLNGREIGIPKEPAEALKHHIVYVSYDRHKEGIVQQLPIQENISLSILGSKLKKLMGLVDKEREIDNSTGYFKQLNIKAGSIYELVGNLSGGNQQKVVISKALSVEPSVLIIDEPTIGIDVKSREEILFLIDELTRSGLSVLYLTNDYNELLRVADRLIFFSDGKVVREAENDGFTAEQVIQMRDSVKGGAA